MELVLAFLLVFVALMLWTGVMVALILGGASLVAFVVRLIFPRRARHHRRG